MVIVFVILIFFFTILYFSFLFFKEINTGKLNLVHRKLSQSVLKKCELYLSGIPEDRKVIIDYNDLKKNFNFLENDFIDRLYSIDPKTVGFNGPKYKTGTAENLVKIESYKFTQNGKVVRESGVQYVPKHVYDDFVKMSAEIQMGLNKIIHIDSGFRSSGRQAYLFMKNLVGEYNYSIEETAKWSAMPGYSEHGDPVNTAVDIANDEGINGFSNNQNPEDFEKLDEYKWLLENAGKFNFILSYPRDNKLGVGFEPWHWHWQNNN